MAGITEDRFIRKRVLKLVYLSATTLFAGVLSGALHRMALGDIFALLFLDVLYAVSFIFYLETGRLHKKKRPDSAEDYQRLCVYYTAGILFMLPASFFPAYTVPAFCIGFCLAAGLDREQAFAVALFLNIHIALCAESTVTAAACTLMLTLLGIVMTGMNKKNTACMHRLRRLH